MSWDKQIPANNPILTKNGLKVLASEIEEEGEIECSTFIYGKGATVKKIAHRESGYTWYEHVPVAIAPNAVVIRLELTSDNGVFVYFKNKASYQTFLKYAKTKRLDYCSGSYNTQTKMYEVMMHF